MHIWDPRFSEAEKKAMCHCSEDRCHHDDIIEDDDVVTYDNLIKDQVAATKQPLIEAETREGVFVPPLEQLR